jgi:hypothetical protein
LNLEHGLLLCALLTPRLSGLPAGLTTPQRLYLERGLFLFTLLTLRFSGLAASLTPPYCLYLERSGFSLGFLFGLRIGKGFLVRIIVLIFLRLVLRRRIGDHQAVYLAESQVDR